MDVESLICDFSSVDINKDKSYFILNNDINRVDIKLSFITEVKLNFYQVWSMFNKIPIVHKSGKIKYEWRFTMRDKVSDEKVLFILCDWNNNNNFINTNNWRVLSNSKDEKIIGCFLNTLCEALECYNTYYKDSIESHTFTSDNSLVNNCLQEIKMSIITNKETLKKI